MNLIEAIETASSKNPKDWPADVLGKLQDGSTIFGFLKEFQIGASVLDVSVELGIFNSKTEARTACKQGSLRLNSEKCAEKDSIGENHILPKIQAAVMQNGKHGLKYPFLVKTNTQ